MLRSRNALLGVVTVLCVAGAAAYVVAGCDELALGAQGRNAAGRRHRRRFG